MATTCEKCGNNPARFLCSRCHRAFCIECSLQQTNREWTEEMFLRDKALYASVGFEFQHDFPSWKKEREAWDLARCGEGGILQQSCPWCGV